MGFRLKDTIRAIESECYGQNAEPKDSVDQDTTRVCSTTTIMKQLEGTRSNVCTKRPSRRIMIRLLALKILNSSICSCRLQLLQPLRIGTELSRPNIPRIQRNNLLPITGISIGKSHITREFLH